MSSQLCALSSKPRGTPRGLSRRQEYVTKTVCAFSVCSERSEHPERSEHSEPPRYSEHSELFGRPEHPDHFENFENSGRISSCLTQSYCSGEGSPGWAQHVAGQRHIPISPKRPSSTRGCTAARLYTQSESGPGGFERSERSED